MRESTIIREIWPPKEFSHQKLICYRPVSHNGEGAVFTSDSAINETLDYVDDFVAVNPTGQLVTGDGTRYHIVDGLIMSLQDRNGNTTSFTYGTNSSDVPSFRQVLSITDSLGRQTTFSYHNFDSASNSYFDQISYGGFENGSRSIKVWRSDLASTLREDYSIETYGQLFHQYEVDPGVSAITYNPSDVVSAVELPDGRRYSFKYSSHDELSRVILPTGGKIEYDYLSLLNLVNAQRRVAERRVYANSSDTVPELTESYGIGDADTSTNLDPRTVVTVTQKNAGGQLLGETKHFFYGRPTGFYTGFYSSWRDGHEYRSQVLNTDGSTVLRQTDTTWQQAGSISWYSNAHDPNQNLAPAKDSRPVETTTTLMDVSPNLVSKTTSINPSTSAAAFDQYNNPTDEWDYDFGSGTPGALLRHSHTDFVTTANGLDYTATGIFLRHLPSAKKLYGYIGGVETLLSRSEMSYDESSLVTRSSPTGWTDPGTAARGNPTTATTWVNTLTEPSATIAAHTTYDTLGNAVTVTDPRGNTATTDYSDRFGTPDNEAQGNTAPSQISGQSTFAFPTKVTDALGHSAYTQYDYFSGLPVNSEDANGVIGKILYEDVLGRPTQSVSAVGTAFQHQMTFTYDDAGRMVTTTTDVAVYGDNKLKGQALYDGLGRTTEKRSYEADGSYFATRTVYDGLGRTVSASNPFKNGTADDQIKWTTTAYDALGRTTAATTPDGAAAHAYYSGVRTLSVDPAGKKQLAKADAAGRLTDVWEIKASDADTESISFPGFSGLSGYHTSYVYDALGNLHEVQQGSQRRDFMYDSLGHLIRAKNVEQEANTSLPSLTDPWTGNGAWAQNYTYDEDGNQKTTVSARNVTITNTFDALNRPTVKHYSDSSMPEVDYFYDTAAAGDDPVANALGKLVKVTNGTATTKFTAYDAAGQLTASQEIIDGQSYGFSYAYNFAGQMASETYPSGRVVTNSFDAVGRLSSVRSAAAGVKLKSCVWRGEERWRILDEI